MPPPLCRWTTSMTVISHRQRRRKACAFGIAKRKQRHRHNDNYCYGNLHPYAYSYSYVYADSKPDPHSDTLHVACGSECTKRNQCDCEQLYRELEQRKRCDRLSVGKYPQATLSPLTYPVIRIWTWEM
jgi:hypothetical protein